MQKLPPCRRDRLTAVDVGTHLMIASNEDINCLSIQPRPWRFRLSSVNDEYHLSRLHSYRNVRFNGDRQPVQCLVDNKQQFRRWHPLRSIGSGDDSLRIASSLYWPRRLQCEWRGWIHRLLLSIGAERYTCMMAIFHEYFLSSEASVDFDVRWRGLE